MQVKPVDEDSQILQALADADKWAKRGGPEGWNGREQISIEWALRFHEQYELERIKLRQQNEKARLKTVGVKPLQIRMPKGV